MVEAANYPSAQKLGKAYASFGTDGIRGKVNTDLTAELALKASITACWPMMKKEDLIIKFS